MEQKFKNLNWPIMTHDKWSSYACVNNNVNPAETVFEFFDI